MLPSLSLEQLPDFPSLELFRDALWGQGEVRGAAVMVGAGFSRCSIRVSQATPYPPLWSTFEKAMLARLYPGAQGGSDPLKLAEEYKASFGAHALDSLIRNLVADEQWLPSELHSRLLGLPWADVLTTNWDTLLERTTLANPDRTYDVVRSVLDIPRTRSPRIVKLHGSLPSQLPFIFTAEDFRTYPRNFPAFINLAQQVLLENELCLIGFSGDDPNFLQWAGWVRDQLGSSARRIRLVGALNLSISQRQVLEQRNVTPIDLAPLVRHLEPGESHEAAARMFLDALWSAKPKPLHIWSRVTNPLEVTAGKTADEAMAELSDVWEADRGSYPGWLVAPTSDRQRLLSEQGNWVTVLREHWANGSVAPRAKLVSELAWRFEVALSPLNAMARDIFSQALTGPETSLLSRSDRGRIANLLTTTARHSHEEDEFSKWVSILEASGGEDSIAWANYQKALKAKDEFEFPVLATLIPLVTGHDPVWGLRQAYLHCALCEFETAARIIRDTKAEIHTRRLRENKSIWLLSREGWAAWVYRSSSWAFGQAQATLDDDYWSNSYHAIASDPWDHVQAIDAMISKEWQERVGEAGGKEPMFDAGSYRDNAKTIRFTGAGWKPVYAVDHAVYLAEYVGLPEAIDMVGIFGDRIARALQVMPLTEEPNALLGAANIRSHSKGLIDYLFARVSVARLSVTVASGLAARLKAAIEYAVARGDSHPWVEKARIYLELLSRVMIRQSPSDAIETFGWAIELSKRPGMAHWWLSEPLAHVLYRSLEAVPPASRGELAVQSLNLKLPSEHNVQGIEREWPELSDKFERKDYRSLKGLNISSRVSQLTEAVQLGDKLNRTRAMLRLLPLIEEDILSSDEKANLAVAVWCRRAGDRGLPSDSDLFPNGFLILPEPNAGEAVSAFREEVIKPLSIGEITSARLIGMQSGTGPWVRHRIELCADETMAIFDRCTEWRPPITKQANIVDNRDQELSAVRTYIGSCLAWAILPGMKSEMIDDERLERWVKAIEHKGVPSFLQTAPYLTYLVPDRAAWVTMVIRKSLVAREESVVKSALSAAFQFVRLHKKFGVAVSPSLCSDIAGMCNRRNEPGLLDVLTVVSHLLSADLLTEDDQLRVIDSLEILLSDLDYNEWDSTDQRTNVLSFLRAECVRLSMAFAQAGRTEAAIGLWIDAQATDPFPEVRFAKIDKGTLEA